MDRELFEIACNYICSILFLINYAITDRRIFLAGVVVMFFCGTYSTIQYLKKK